MAHEKINASIMRQLAEYIQLDSRTWKQLFDKHIHPNSDNWKMLFKYMLIIMGIGFFVTGVFFFFAYNWDAMHKFVKLSIVELLLIISLFFAIRYRKKAIISNILLTTSSLLVGAMFAVFGQVYQTGANAFDFFLGWTIFITLWTIVARFEFLYILFFILIHLCIRFYTEQLAFYWSEKTEIYYHTLLSVIYFIFFSLTASRFSWKHWFIQLLTLSSFFFSTTAICIVIHSSYHLHSLGITALYIIILAYTLYFALQHKSIFFLSVLALSVIIVGASLLLKVNSDSSMFLLVSLYIIASITATIMKLLSLQKKWKHE